MTCALPKFVRRPLLLPANSFRNSLITIEVSRTRCRFPVRKHGANVTSLWTAQNSPSRVACGIGYKPQLPEAFRSPFSCARA